MNISPKKKSKGSLRPHSIGDATPRFLATIRKPTSCTFTFLVPTASMSKRLLRINEAARTAARGTQPNLGNFPPPQSIDPQGHSDFPRGVFSFLRIYSRCEIGRAHV